MSKLAMAALGAALGMPTTSVAQTPTSLRTCSVVFLDGAQVVVRECTFRYPYYHRTAADSRFLMAAFWDTTDLLLEVARRTERGTAVEERTIAASDLASIRFTWQVQPDRARRSLKAVTVALRSGEIVSLGSLVPAIGLVTGGGQRPEFIPRGLLLQGEVPGLLLGTFVRFSKSLDVPYSDEVPSELIAEIRF